MITSRHRITTAALLGLALVAGCGNDSTTEPTPPTATDAHSGGETTIFNASSAAFSFPAPNLDGSAFNLHTEGDAAFEATFVTAPANVNAGLGPVYNNTSCIGCHARDGRGRPPLADENFSSMLFRISIPGADAQGGPNPVPGFGGQLQDRGVFGIPAEGKVNVTYIDRQGTFADGLPYTLREPRYVVASSYRPIPAGMMISPRVAPPVFGLGLLEAIPESALLANADPSDQNGDGISGRANYVWDAQADRTTIGRFGWKAGAPSLLQQAAAAYNNDMGITSTMFKLETCHGQTQCDTSSDDPEVDLQTLKAAAHYTATLAVPARRGLNDTRVQRGEVVFRAANCNRCHMETLQTGVAPNAPYLSNQTIHPYTDLLLHDMGDELADNRPDYLADGREWRTPPLWGIGLTRIVSGHTFFLHDGRARDLMEAILWHGGEAATARNYVQQLPRADRDALIAFLESW